MGDRNSIASPLDKVVGILGGGQLGRMLAAAASQLNVRVVVLDTGAHAPAKQVVAPRGAHLAHIDGSITDAAPILALARAADVLTFEIEHVNIDVLEEAVRRVGAVEVHPAPATVRLIQDKYTQKGHLAAHGVPVVPFLALDDPGRALATLGGVLVVKRRRGAYDGRGNAVVHGLLDARRAIERLGGAGAVYAEQKVAFEREVAVMVVRSAAGEMRSYPAVETVHRDGVCHLVFAPLRGEDAKLGARAQALAERAVASLEGAGVFGVEMFLMQDGTLYVNEIAPRPHNSGHYTIEACETSQFENHLRAILGLPLGSTALRVPVAAMLNILGPAPLPSSDEDQGPIMDPDTAAAVLRRFAETALAVPGASVHMYGKDPGMPGRKMGHVTLVADCDAQLRARLRPLLAALPSPKAPSVDVEAERALELAHYAPEPGGGRKDAHALVGIIMGSDSDLGVMAEAAKVLERLGVAHEVTLVSAHRTPERLAAYARGAAGRGVRVIVAGAGGAAHLPGMVAAMTPLPVVGVPVGQKGGALGGVDALYSIVQMPRGVPVATVAINNAANAALLAVRILGAGMPRLLEAVERYMEEMRDEVLVKVERLEAVGWESYQAAK